MNTHRGSRLRLEMGARRTEGWVWEAGTMEFSPFQYILAQNSEESEVLS